MADKKSFMLYYDMYPSICDLSDEQRGALFAALFEYAEQAIREPDCMQQVMARHANMNDATKMAFSFIAKTIERDTIKWLEKQERYTRAAENRWKQRGQRLEEAPPSGTKRGVIGAENAWSYVE